MLTQAKYQLPFESRPEAELLLACARTAPDTETMQQISALLGEPLDWDIVIELARRHGVVPLLVTTLQVSFADAVPPDMLATLRADYLAGAQQSMALTAELLRLLKLFDQAGVQALPLKGPALAALAYGNLSLRWFGDLDILVHQHDVLAAKAILLAQGYDADPPLTDREEAPRLRTHYVYAFVRENDSSLVEIHYRVRPRYFAFDLGSEQLWEQLGSVALGGTAVPSLAPEDLLLFLCAHGANHCWERLAWVCDIAELLRACANVDQRSLLARARVAGSERMLLLGLRLAHDLLGAPLSAAFVDRMNGDRAINRLAVQVFHRLFNDIDAPNELFAATLFHLRARERWRDRIRYCLGVATVTSAEDWALLPLPAALAFIYTLIRPFRLAGTYGSGLLRLLPGWRKS